MTKSTDATSAPIPWRDLYERIQKELRAHPRDPETRIRNALLLLNDLHISLTQSARATQGDDAEIAEAHRAAEAQGLTPTLTSTPVSASDFRLYTESQKYGLYATAVRYWNNVRDSLPVTVPEKWRGYYASFYNGYWYVKRSHAEKELAQSASESISDNWTAIVRDYGERIGRKYKRAGEVFRFFGLVHGDDDYYYGMASEKDGRVLLASCVGTLETMGFEEIEPASTREDS